jgi:hypothetical protein
MEGKEKPGDEQSDRQKTSFWVDSIISVPNAFLEQIGYPVNPNSIQEKTIFPIPKSRKEKAKIEAIIYSVSQVMVSKKETEAKLEELKGKSDFKSKVESIYHEAILQSHPTLIGIGAITSSELVKGQEELKNKGLEELSRRKIADLYQYTKAKELEND